ncbi:phosphonate metabolism protein PhnG [Peptococcaceae bacterium CEB3]|nr:phosphonate metabolism protein PhnG [Peptococcaceae bacterium CEB3]
MVRKRRTEILINGSKEIAGRLAEEIAGKYEVAAIEEPGNGLVMVKVRETAKRSLFYLGEVFISECKVMINRCVGVGMVKGHEPELAYHLAVVDAAYNADLAETKAWTEVLLLEEERIGRQREALKSKILKTKVNFETMDA